MTTSGVQNIIEIAKFEVFGRPLLEDIALKHAFQCFLAKRGSENFIQFLDLCNMINSVSNDPYTQTIILNQIYERFTKNDTEFRLNILGETLDTFNDLFQDGLIAPNNINTAFTVIAEINQEIFYQFKMELIREFKTSHFFSPFISQSPQISSPTLTKSKLGTLSPNAFLAAFEFWKAKDTKPDETKNMGLGLKRA